MKFIAAIAITLSCHVATAGGTLPIPTDNGWILYNSDNDSVTVHSYDGATPLSPSQQRRQNEEATKREIAVEMAKLREERIQKCIDNNLAKQNKYNKRPVYFVRKQCEREVR